MNVVGAWTILLSLVAFCNEPHTWQKYLLSPRRYSSAVETVMASSTVGAAGTERISLPSSTVEDAQQLSQILDIWSFVSMDSLIVRETPVRSLRMYLRMSGASCWVLKLNSDLFTSAILLERVCKNSLGSRVSEWFWRRCKICTKDFGRRLEKEGSSSYLVQNSGMVLRACNKALA